MSLSILPKDVARIVYSYLYGIVVKDIKKIVGSYIYPNKPRRNQMKVYGDQNNILESPACKIHICHNKTPYWERSKDSILGNINVCKKLLLCQDKFKMWNPKFDRKVRISIINGVVYHFTTGVNKYRLVPVFESNYCWQDLAMMFLRIRDQDKNNDVLNMSRKEKIKSRDTGCFIF